MRDWRSVAESRMKREQYLLVSTRFDQSVEEA